MQTISTIINKLTGITSQSHLNEEVEGNTRATKTNDAAAPCSNPVPRSLPPIVTSIPSGLSEQASRAPRSSSNNLRPPNPTRGRIGTDEKRLCGDYTTPADATYAPSPEDFFNSVSMKHKPGPNSLRPVNTIDDVNYFPSEQKKRTTHLYGSPGRGHGQLRYLDSHNVRVPELSTVNAHLESYQSPPRKRRKTMNTDLVDLVDDDDVTQINCPAPQNNHSSPNYPLSVMSKSQLSRDSRPPWNSGSWSRGALPASSFQNTDRVADSHRKQSRNGSVILPRSRSLTPIDLVNEHRSKRSPVLVSDLDELAPDFATKSHHFGSHVLGRGRNNSSTSTQGTSVKTGRVSKEDVPKNIRDTFRRSHENIQDDEQDELFVTREVTAHSVHRSQSLFKRGSQANTATKRRGSTQVSAWPLSFVRSRFYRPDGSDLALRSSTDKVFEIIYLDSGATATDEVINLKKIVEAEADGVWRIRLKGSRNPAGHQYVFDVGFTKTDDFKVFCRTYVEPNTKSGSIILRSELHMKKLFDKALVTKDVVELPTPVDDNELSLIETRARNARLARDHGPPLKDFMVNKMSPGNANNVNRESRASSGAGGVIYSEGASSLARLPRSTRSNHARHEVINEKTPALKEKMGFSVEHGLGTPWDKPLQYGSGRRRALVNFSDLERLDEDVFLNDSLIDFYLIYLFEQAQIPVDKVYFFNTHFYTTLTRPVPGERTAINYAGVARWTAREDIFNYDYIVVPINESSHWYLAIICNVNNISRKLDMNGLGPSSPVAESMFDLASEPNVERVENQNTTPAAAQSPDETNPPKCGEGFTVFDEDESKINLVNAEAVETSGQPPALAAESVSTQSSPVIETVRLEELALSDSTPKEMVGNSALSAKKKMKRKIRPALQKYDPEKSIIVVLDSLENTHPKAVRVLKEYILEEGKAKRSMKATIEQKTFYVKSNHIPMQENFSDCGVYLLGYAQKFFANPREFSNRLLLREMSPETDWPDLNASEMRNQMRRVLQGLRQDQEAERKKARAEKKAVKAVPPPRETERPVARPEPRLRSPFEEKPKPEPNTRSKSPRRPNLVKAEDLQSRSDRKRSPIVLIPPKSPKSPKSPKRPVSASPRKLQDGDNGVPGPYFTINSSVEIHSPKKQKQDHTRTISPLHLSSEKSKTPTSVSSWKSPGASKGTPTFVTQFGPSEMTQSHRGSSIDPIRIEDSQDTLPIDDSQDGSIILAPKKERKSPTKVTKIVTSGTPKKHSRSTLSMEEPTRCLAADEEMLLCPDSVDNLSKVGQQAHTVEEWNGFEDDDGSIPESPVHKRRSPSQGRFFDS